MEVPLVALSVGRKYRMSIVRRGSSRILKYIFSYCDQNENGDDWQACSQMNDTNRVDQRPRKWSVNPQHKLVGLLLFFPSLQCILVDVHVV